MSDTDRLPAWALRTLGQFRKSWDDYDALDTEQLEFAALHAAGVAYTRYDPTRGMTLRTWIITCVARALRDERRVMDHLSRAQRAHARAEQTETGEAPPWAAPPASLSSLLAGDAADDAGSLADTLADPGPGPEALALARLEREALAQALAALPERERTALRLYYWHGRTGPQVAAHGGFSEPTFWKLRRRALGTLRRLLAPAEATR